MFNDILNIFDSFFNDLVNLCSDIFITDFLYSDIYDTFVLDSYY